MWLAGIDTPIKKLAYLEHISTFCILLAYDRLEGPVAPLSGASRPARGLDNDPRGLG